MQVNEWWAQRYYQLRLEISSIRIFVPIGFATKMGVKAYPLCTTYTIVSKHVVASAQSIPCQTQQKMQSGSLNSFWVRLPHLYKVILYDCLDFIIDSVRKGCARAKVRAELHEHFVWRRHHRRIVWSFARCIRDVKIHLYCQTRPKPILFTRQEYKTYGGANKSIGSKTVVESGNGSECKRKVCKFETVDNSTVQSTRCLPATVISLRRPPERGYSSRMWWEYIRIRTSQFDGSALLLRIADS